MKKYTLFITLFIFLNSCQSSKKQEEIIELFDGKTLNIELGLPTSASLYSNYLFVNDFYGDSGLVKIIDIQKEEIINSFAVKGEGPNEFLTVANIDYAPSLSQNFYVFDQAANKLKVFNFDSLVYNKQKNPQAVININENLRFYEVAKSKQGFIATGIIENKKFALLNDSMHVRKWAGSYCSKPSKSIPDITHAMANYGKFYITDDRKWLVNIIYAAGIITCYQINENGDLSLVWEKILNEMNYKLEGSSYRNLGTMGYLSVSFTKKHIYALYSGQEENNDEIATYGKEIHVFDYEGHIIKKYLLDTPALNICVTENDKYIYSIVHKPESGIIQYEL